MNISSKKEINKMRFIFLMYAFPDLNKSYNMYTTLVKNFVDAGLDVTVIAPSLNNKTHISIENGVEVLRVKTLTFKNVSPIRKALSNFLLPYQFRIANYIYYKNRVYDVVILPTPPISLVNFAHRLKKTFNCFIYLILRDIFPQNAVDLKLMKAGSIVHKYYSYLENKIYTSADLIGCMSKANVSFLQNQNPNIPSSKLVILRNWQVPLSDKCTAISSIYNKLKLENKFVTIFGGNIGIPQKIDNIVELARRFIDCKDIVFLVIGEGCEYNRMKNLINKYNLKNIIMIHTIDKVQYQYLLKKCSIGLISLHEDFTIPNHPSRILDYLNVGIPVVASIDKNTDLRSDFIDGNFGLFSNSGDYDSFYRNILTLYNDRSLLNLMSINAKIYFNKYLTDDIATRTILDQINNSIS